MQYESIIHSLGGFKELLKGNTKIRHPCHTVLKWRKKNSLTHWWLFYSMQPMWTSNRTSELWNTEFLPLLFNCYHL